ncbi:MAG: 4Fe-4S dicluster domain-containing protein [Treponema sp.]|nr:4Fe-4S dicluster domain-containing protein [Candidatus Treponema equifaecale]
MVLASNFKSVDEGKINLTANAFLPATAAIPLEEDENDYVETFVTQGTPVTEGQVIAKTKNLYIHASIPGTVQEIYHRQYSNGKQGTAVKIALKGEFNFTGKNMEDLPYSSMEASTLSYILKEAGIINTFRTNKPIYEEIKKIQDKANKILVLRLFDDDPSRLTEEFVSQNYTKKVIVGARICADAIGAKSIVIAQNKNKLIDISEFTEGFGSAYTLLEVQLDSKKYPSGTMHNLVSAVKKASKDETFKTLGKDDFFIDSITALHVYEAVIYNKPVLNTFVHITGDCLNSAAIMNVKLGTSLKNIVEQCGGFKRKLSKIIINGIVLGRAVASLNIPISKRIKSIEFVPVKQVRAQFTENCMRCGNCRKICPVDLWPGNLYRVLNLSGQKNDFLNTDKIASTALLCTECGLCNSVCPSRLPLSQSISILKEMQNEQK